MIVINSSEQKCKRQLFFRIFFFSLSFLTPYRPSAGFLACSAQPAHLFLSAKFNLLTRSVHWLAHLLGLLSSGTAENREKNWDIENNEIWDTTWGLPNILTNFYKVVHVDYGPCLGLSTLVRSKANYFLIIDTRLYKPLFGKSVHRVRRSVTNSLSWIICPSTHNFVSVVVPYF